MPDRPPDENVVHPEAVEPPAAQPSAEPQLAYPAFRRLTLVLLSIFVAAAIFHREIRQAFRTSAAERHSHLADERIQAGDFSGGIQEIDAALGWMPDDPALVYLRAQTYALAGDREAALEDYTRLIEELAPKFAPALVRRANLHRERNDLDQAIADLDRALDLGSGDDLSILNDRAYSRALADRDLDRALEEINHVLTASSDASPRAVYLDTRGYIYYRLGEYELGLADIESSLARLTVEHTELLEAYKKNRIPLGNLERLYAHSRGEILFHRGLLLQATGDAIAADQDFQQASSLGFECPPAAETSTAQSNPPAESTGSDSDASPARGLPDVP